MTHARKPYAGLAAITFAAAALLSCPSTNPNASRVLISIAVTPSTANAATYPNGQVTFTATGTFNLPPITAPLSFAAPYTGSFVVDNPGGQTIATIVSTGTGTIIVQCASGVAGNVNITASADSNNQSGTIVSGNALLICP
jgi:hypothetical protein